MAIHHIPEALAVGVAASAASQNEISEGQVRAWCHVIAMYTIKVTNCSFHWLKCAFERVDIHEDLDSLGCHGTSKYS